MPHCVIEYSQDVAADPAELIDAVFNGALASKLFEEHHIKTRAICFDHYQIGALTGSFIHINARILSGRTPEQRAKLSQCILAELIKLKLSHLVITVDVAEMDRESYAKKNCITTLTL